VRSPTGRDILDALCREASSSRDGTATIASTECARWPSEVFKALVDAELIYRAGISGSVLCPGCWRSCSKPVTLLPEPVVLCDENEDLGIIAIDPTELENWVFSRARLAEFIEDNLTTKGAGGHGHVAPLRSSDLETATMTLTDWVYFDGSRLEVRPQLLALNPSPPDNLLPKQIPPRKSDLVKKLGKIERAERDDRIVKEIKRRAAKLGPRKISQICKQLAKEKFEGMSNWEALRRPYYRQKKAGHESMPNLPKR
jgi:hypothetical protein